MSHSLIISVSLPNYPNPPPDYKKNIGKIPIKTPRSRVGFASVPAYRTARDCFTSSSPAGSGTPASTLSATAKSPLACVDQNGKPRALPEWLMPGVTKRER